jgi:hypothetical protein
MTQAARKVLATFDALPEDDKQAVTVEILRRVPLEDYSALNDSELVLAAEQVFLELDREESE